MMRNEICSDKENSWQRWPANSRCVAHTIYSLHTFYSFIFARILFGTWWRWLFFVAPQKKSTKPLKVRSVCANNERFSHKNSNDEHKHWTYEWHTSSCAFDYFSTFVRLFVVLSLFGPFFVVDFVVAVVVCDIHSVRNSGCRRRLSYRSFRAFDSE